jgi:EamA-like transporter family.
VLFALGSVTIQALDHDLPMEALQGWAMLVGAFILFGAGALRGETVPDIQSLSPAVVGSLLYIALVSGAFGYLLFFRLVRRVGATETTLVTYLEPLSATAVSALVLHQTVGRTTLVGFVAVAAGFTVVSRDTMRRTVGQLRDTETPRTGHDPGGD